MPLLSYFMYTALKEAIWHCAGKAENEEDYSGNPPEPFAYCDEGQGKEWDFDLGIYVALRYLDAHGLEKTVAYRAYEGGEYGVEWYVAFYSDYAELSDWQWKSIAKKPGDEK